MTKGCLTAGRSRPFPAARNSALAAANFSASSQRKQEAMGGSEVVWCSTYVPTGSRTLEGHTTSSNFARNTFRHSGDSSGEAADWLHRRQRLPPQRPVDPGDCSDWPALAAQAAASPPQGPVDSGDGGDWTAVTGRR